ncbi:hypothetical protein K503DRAFT_270171 [Rhizopogon vinicolor AM-OR11-026]|uniref:Uncharacterized protein n=1 Tax=Rhizopogon vinicolor AM-OR11-026 TaxID=1314800 RepID=A0A1B7MWD7_9AGAM|nr:hypothetical protein K503DRAFT_270171 [Rhizopogon vinicolor AM-OR11-026]
MLAARSIIFPSFMLKLWEQKNEISSAPYAIGRLSNELNVAPSTAVLMQKEKHDLLPRHTAQESGCRLLIWRAQ